MTEFCLALRQNVCDLKFRIWVITVTHHYIKHFDYIVSITRMTREPNG